MKSFKTDYCEYMEQLELSYEKPNVEEFYKKSKQYKSTYNALIRRRCTGIAVATAIVLVAIFVMYRTDFVAYAYETITNVLVQYNILNPQNADTSAIKIEKEVFEKTFTSVSEIADIYDLEIMESSLAYKWSSEYTVAIGYGEGENINAIRIIAPYYIMGDLPIKEELLYKPDENAIINPFNYGIYGDDDYMDDLYEGYKYQTPIYLSMYINVSDEISKWTSVYDEVDGEIIEYISDYNMKCIIISKEFQLDGIDGLNPTVKAYGIKDDVQYCLEGRVTVETMKEIIDSFE